jgi:hypothetical protein
MKKALISFVFLVAATALFAQAPIGIGQAQINAGFGFSSWGLPVYGGVEFGVHEDITVGGELSFRTYNDTYLDDNYGHTIVGISANGNYHFNTLLDIPEEWDVYAGANLGYYIWHNKNSDYSGSGSSGLGLGLQAGGRYYFNDKFGVNLEFGSGNSFSGGKIGISIRL